MRHHVHSFCWFCCCCCFETRSAVNKKGYLRISTICQWFYSHVCCTSILLKFIVTTLALISYGNVRNPDPLFTAIRFVSSPDLEIALIISPTHTRISISYLQASSANDLFAQARAPGIVSGCFKINNSDENGLVCWAISTMPSIVLLKFIYNVLPLSRKCFQRRYSFLNLGAA